MGSNNIPVPCAINQGDFPQGLRVGGWIPRGGALASKVSFSFFLVLIILRANVSVI